MDDNIVRTHLKLGVIIRTRFDLGVTFRYLGLGVIYRTHNCGRYLSYTIQVGRYLSYTIKSGRYLSYMVKLDDSS